MVRLPLILVIRLFIIRVREEKYPKEFSMRELWDFLVRTCVYAQGPMERRVSISLLRSTCYRFPLQTASSNEPTHAGADDKGFFHCLITTLPDRFFSPLALLLPIGLWRVKRYLFSSTPRARGASLLHRRSNKKSSIPWHESNSHLTVSTSIASDNYQLRFHLRYTIEIVWIVLLPW